MLHRFGMFALVITGLFSFGAISAAEPKAEKKHAEEKEDKAPKKKGTWAVVQSGEEIMVMPSEDAAKTEKDMAKAAKDKEKAADKSSKDAKAKKAPKKSGKDEKIVFKILKDKFATEDEAKKYREEILAKEKKKKDEEDKKKKGSKGKAKGKEKEADSE
jgi:hypothetical protein